MTSDKRRDKKSSAENHQFAERSSPVGSRISRNLHVSTPYGLRQNSKRHLRSQTSNSVQIGSRATT